MVRFFSGQSPEEEHGGKDGNKEAVRSWGHHRARQPGEAHVPLAVQDFPPQRAHGGEFSNCLLIVDVSKFVFFFSFFVLFLKT